MKTALAIAFMSLASVHADETELVAAVLIGEAGGEPNPWLSMEAVMEVIQNRAKGSGLSFGQVVRDKGQFSCLNRVAPAKLVKKAKVHTYWNIALDIAHGVKTNHTRRADHFCERGAYPKWASLWKLTVIIGNHKFYRIGFKKGK